AVDDRGQHAHVVARRPIHAFGAGRDAAEDIAAADDDADLDAEAANLRDICGDAGSDGGVDAERLFAHQRLPGEFQEDAFIQRGRRNGHTSADYSRLFSAFADLEPGEAGDGDVLAHLGR